LLQLYEFHNRKEHVLNSQNATFWTNALQDEVYGNLNIAKIRRFWIGVKNFAVQKPFPLLITTDESCWHVTIKDRRRSVKILERIQHFLKTCKVTN